MIITDDKKSYNIEAWDNGSIFVDEGKLDEDGIVEDIDCRFEMTEDDLIALLKLYKQIKGIK